MSQLKVVLPALTALTYMTRMIGVTLLGAAFVSMLLSGWRKEGPAEGLKKAVLFGALSSIPFAIWTLRGSFYDGGVATYHSIFAQADYYSLDRGSAGLGSLFERFSTNCGYYFEGVCKAVVTLAPVKDALPWAVFLLIFLLIVLGFIKEIVSKREMKDFYFLFYMGLLTVWPVYGSGDARRYLVPLIPLIYHYLFAGAAFLLSAVKPFRTGGRYGYLSAPLVMLIFLLSFNGADMAHRASGIGRGFDAVRRAMDGSLFEKISRPRLADMGAERFRKELPCYYNYLLASDRLNGIVSGTDLVTARKPEVVFLITGKPVVRFPYTADAGLMERFIREKKVSHVLLDGCYEETDKYMRSFVRARPEGFRIMLSDNRGTAVLKVQQPAFTLYPPGTSIISTEVCPNC